MNMLKNLVDLVGPDGLYGFSDMAAAEMIETVLSKYDSAKIEKQSYENEGEENERSNSI